MDGQTDKQRAFQTNERTSEREKIGRLSFLFLFLGLALAVSSPHFFLIGQ